MKINYKKILILPFFLCSVSYGSLLYDIEKGISEFNNGNFENSKNYFSKYVISNPNCKDGYWYLAKSYLSLGDKKNATKYFEKAYKKTASEKSIEKISFENHSGANLEDYFDMAAMYFETGNTKEADFYADMMLKINPKSPSAFFIKSKVAMINNDKKSAEEYIKKAIIFNNELLDTQLAKDLAITSIPEMTKEMFNLFAVENYFQGNIDEAVKYLEKYNEIEKNPDVMNMLADCYLKKNNIAKAKDIINELRKYFDNNIDSYLYEAKIAKLENKDNDIIDILLKANKINPNHAKCLFEIGNYYLENKNYENAIKYYETLLSVNDSFYEGYCGYIYSLIQIGKLDKAVSSIRKLTSINPNSSEISFLLAEICYKEANYNEALSYLTEAIKKDKNPYYYFERAKINYLLQENVSSIEDLENAINSPIKYDIENEISEYFIRNYMKLGDLENAEAYLNGKLSLDKNSYIYKYNLYNLEKLQGKRENKKFQLAKLGHIQKDEIKNCIDLAEITYYEKGLVGAIKVLDSAIKKYPSLYQLYSEKIKYYYLSNELEKVKETIKETKTLFQ